MSDFVTVLECQEGKRLAKWIGEDLSVADYDAGWLVRATAVPLEGLADLARLLRVLDTDPSTCIIRGRLREGAASEWVPRRSRDREDVEADFAEPEHGHSWFCVDLDASAITVDWASPDAVLAAVEAWRATLPAPLRAAGCIFQLSAKAGLVPYLRGHGWFWASASATDAQLKAWLLANELDDSACLAQAVQVHYTAAPVGPGAAAAYAGERVFTFDGPSAVVDWAAVEAPPERARTMGARARDFAVRDEGAPEPTERIVRLADAMRPAYEGGGRIAGNALLNFFGWALNGAHGFTRGDMLALLDVLAEPDPSKAAEHVHVLGNARPLEGPGAAREWLGGAFATVDAIMAEPRMAMVARLRAGAGGGDTSAFQPMASAFAGADLDLPALLSAPKRAMYIRDGDGYFGPVPLELMRGTLRAVGLVDLLGTGSDGKPLKDESLYKCGAPIHTIVRSFEETGTRYDAEEFTLYQGYQLPHVEPVRADAVAAWLEALAGAQVGRVLDWITLCSQANIHRRAAALVIIGEHSTGKSLIFKCLARMWGALTYVALKDAAAQFNASVCESPIVCDDECQALKAKLVTSEEFRERVQARVRKYEPKGFEKVHLLGYTRECVAANSPDEVTIARVTSASTREAIEARLCVVQVPDTAAARGALLAIAGGDEDAEARAIMGHMAWLWATHTVVSRERFAGAGGLGVHAVALAGVADEGAEVWEYLHGALEGDGAAAFIEDGTTRPFMIREGRLLAYPASLVSMLNQGQKSGRTGRTWDLRTAGRVLGAIRTGEREASREGGKVVRLWPLDAARACDLAGVSAETRARVLAATKRGE